MKERRLRLLLVDDDQDTLTMMGRILSLDGYEVHHSRTAAEAIARCEDERFDLMISDLGLPDQDGYELMRTLTERCKLKGIALSGYAMDEDVKRAHDAGFVEHLAKPVSIDKLRDAIRRATAE